MQSQGRTRNSTLPSTQTRNPNRGVVVQVKNQQQPWTKIQQHITAILKQQQLQQEQLLREHAQSQLKRQSSKDGELKGMIHQLREHILLLEKQQRDHLDVIKKQLLSKQQQALEYEKQQQEWQMIVQNLIETLQTPAPTKQSDTTTTIGGIKEAGTLDVQKVHQDIRNAASKSLSREINHSAGQHIHTGMGNTVDSDGNMATAQSLLSGNQSGSSATCTYKFSDIRHR